jgi:hypothetical protein
MMRLAVLLASAVINVSTIPALASECASAKILMPRARWAIVRNQPTKTADNQTTCRAYAASFYESVTLRQRRRAVQSRRGPGAEPGRARCGDRRLQQPVGVEMRQLTISNSRRW